MDDLDRKILTLLAKNARMPVKEIAEQVSLTSPAVSSRIHKLETDGIISGYTVTLNRPADRMYVDALISLSVAPSKQDGTAGASDFAVPEAGHHQHSDHPVHPGEPRRSGRFDAVSECCS